MLRKIATVVALPLVMALVLIVSACGGGSSIKPTWIEPTVSGETVSIPLSDVEQKTIVHFWVETGDGEESFMAYRFNGVTYTRADVCVPCRSIEFSLEEDVLVCAACGTKFSAATGKGVSGACKDYPKAAVTFALVDGNMVMSMGDLEKAYYNTVHKIG